MAERETLRPSFALAAYVESLLEGRRAIVFGDSSSDIAERLLERGARLVHVYDADNSRVVEAATRNSSRSVSYAPLGEGGLAVREGAFDVAIVEDLSAATEPAQLLRKVKRCLGPRGVALVATRNPEVRTELLTGSVPGKLSYYELYDTAIAEFEEVRMLGQTPFVAYAVVDFAPAGEPQVSLDNGFVPGGAEEPEFFIALASSREIKLDEFSVIQLPTKDVLAQRGGSASARQLESALSREKSTRARLEKLEGELQEQRAKASGGAGSAGEQQARVEAARNQGAQAAREQAAKDDAAKARRLAELEREVDKRGRWISELEARSAAADMRADSIQAELDKASHKWGRLTSELESTAAELQATRKSLDSAQKQLDRSPAAKSQAQPASRQGAPDLDRKLREAEQRLADEVNRSATLERERNAARDALQGSNEQRDKARDRAAKLQEELRRAESTASQLQGKLGQTSRQGNPEVSAELDRLEQALRERGEVIRGLERQLQTAERLGKQLLAEMLELREGAAHAQAKPSAPAPAVTAPAAAATPVGSRAAADPAGTPQAPDATQAALLSSNEQRDKARDRAAKLQEELRRAEAAAAELQRRLDAATREGASEVSAELGRLEQALRERGEQIRRLERELQTAERFGKQMLAEMLEHKAAAQSAPSAEPAAGAPVGAPPVPLAAAAAPPPPALSDVVSKVAADNAQLQADLQAARWSIEELEVRLASLAAGESELQLSKQLAAARAELQRKAALIAQLQGSQSA